MDAHGLRERSSTDSLERCAALSGLQDNPEGSALSALGARLKDLDLETYQRALYEEKTLVRLWGMRGAPYVVPTRDAHVFTIGALPEDDDSLATMLTGDMSKLHDAGVSALEAFESAVEGVEEVLNGPMRKRDLSEALHGHLPRQLEPWCESCQANHIPDGLLRIVGLTGRIVFGPRVEGSPALLKTRDWLGRDFRHEDASGARQALARRFLRRYGPVAPVHFATWTNLAAADARRTWERLHDELAPVVLDGKRSWTLKDNADALRDPPRATGARFLPPNDPFLAQRDRETLLPQPELRRKVWRPVSNPGVLLLDGEPKGTWRARAKPRELEISLEPWGSISSPRRAELREEATVAARLRGRPEAALIVQVR